jgi:hypothetical protein
MKQKQIKNLSNSINNFIEMLSFDYKNVYLMGTMSNKELQYYADVDLFEDVKTKYKSKHECLQYYEKTLKDIVMKLLTVKDCYISKIILGLEDEKPKKWKPKQLLKSDLVPYLEMPAMTKIDVIKLIDGIYTDFSIVYRFYNNNQLVNKYELFKKKDLKEDIKKFLNDKNYYKMCKRIFTLTNDKIFVSLFNSDVGKMSQIMSNLETVIFMLDNYKISKIKVNEEINIIVNKLNSIHEVKDYLQNETKFVNILKSIQDYQNSKVYYKDLIKLLNKVVKYLNSVVQKETKKWLSKNYDYTSKINNFS